jgi:hypothetical protein
LAPDPCPQPPSPRFSPLPESLPKLTLLCRIHARRFSPTSFNPWKSGGARPTRFAPFPGPTGEPVPTLYAATSFRVALAESLFHDLPRELPDISVSQSKVHELSVSWIRPVHDLRLISFRGTSLRRLRVEWNRLIGSLPTCYPSTQLWARAAHQSAGDFHGIVWNSRQYDGAPCLMLFGDRFDSTALETIEDRIPLAGPRYEADVLRECEQANITVTPA